MGASLDQPQKPAPEFTPGGTLNGVRPRSHLPHSLPVGTNGRWGFRGADHSSDQGRHSSRLFFFAAAFGKAELHTSAARTSPVNPGAAGKELPGGCARHSGSCSLRATPGHVAAGVSGACAPRLTRVWLQLWLIHILGEHRIQPQGVWQVGFEGLESAGVCKVGRTV